MKKRMISFAVAMLMILSILPAAAFAADSISITVGAATVEPSNTVTVDVSIAGASAAALMAAYFDIDFDSALTLNSVTLSDAATQAGFTFGQNNLSEGIIQIDGDSSGSNISDGVFFSMEFTANETASGTYSVSIKCLDDSAENVNDGDYAVPCTFTAGSVTVGSSGDEEGPELSVTSGYSAAISTNATAAAQGETVTVDVIVAADENTTGFSSAKMEVQYDTTKLTYKGIVCNQTADKISDGESTGDFEVSAVDNNGTITITDYGTHITAATTGTAVYTLTFEAKDGGAAVITLESSAFSTLTRAEEDDLLSATVSDENKTATVNVKHKVTVDDETHEFTVTPENVADGESVTIAAQNPYYNYTLSVNGSTTLTGDDPWTIENVTDDITISVEKAEGKPVNVTIKIVDEDGNEIADDENNTTTTDGAKYGDEFTYDIPDDTNTETTSGVAYAYSKTTIGGVEPTTGVTCTNDVVTIDGTAITDDIVIVVTRTDVDATKVTVKVEGDASSSEYECTSPVEKGSDAVLTLTKDSLYDYTVTATMGGENVAVEISESTYTVKSVGAAVVFTIKKTVNVDNAEVSQYVQLNGTVMWLVKMPVLENKTYTYNGEKMYSLYNSNVILVVAESNPKESGALADGLKIVDGEAQELEYTNDVNGSGTVDLNDAQLIWNMYNAVYSDFTTTVGMEKFLLADAAGEHDGIINVQDIAVIVNSLN